MEPDAKCVEQSWTFVVRQAVKFGNFGCGDSKGIGEKMRCTEKPRRIESHGSSSARDKGLSCTWLKTDVILKGYTVEGSISF